MSGAQRRSASMAPVMVNGRSRRATQRDSSSGRQGVALQPGGERAVQCRRDSKRACASHPFRKYYRVKALLAGRWWHGGAFCYSFYTKMSESVAVNNAYTGKAQRATTIVSGYAALGGAAVRQNAAARSSGYHMLLRVAPNRRRSCKEREEDKATGKAMWNERQHAAGHVVTSRRRLCHTMLRRCLLRCCCLRQFELQRPVAIIAAAAALLLSRAPAAGLRQASSRRTAAVAMLIDVAMILRC